MKKCLLIYLLINAYQLFAGQGLYLRVNSYIPYTAIKVISSSCVKHSDKITLNKIIYLEAKDNLKCFLLPSKITFAINDTKNNKIIYQYNLKISVNGSSINNTTPPNLNNKTPSPYIQSAFLYPKAAGYADEQDRVIISAALNTSAWMKTVKNLIQNKNLKQLYFPGSHDSGTSNITKDSPLTPDASATITKLYDKAKIIVSPIIAS